MQAAADYFVVGPTLVLRSLRGPGPDGEVVFVVARGGETAGTLDGRAEEGGFHLSLASSALGGEERAEAYRLFARVCVRLGDPGLPLLVSDEDDPAVAGALRGDGFRENSPGRWVRGRDAFVRPPEERTRNMDDVYADPYHIPWNFVPRESEVLDALRSHPELAAPPGARVLDLGCGSGKNSVALEETGFVVHGIDVSPTAVERCRTLVRRPERFVAGSAARLPWESGYFERVLDIGCLHCMPDDERPAAVAEIARVLAPGGLLVSRIFKPRDRAWLDAQPFRTERLGLSDGEVAALFAAHFCVRRWKDDPHVHYLACTPL